MKILLRKLKPTQVLVLGFAALILVGTALLNLPEASQNGKSVGVLDAFFTATSAVCVTGLAVVNTASHWTVFGKVVLLFLIQIGGLGFMSLTATLFLLLGKKIGLRQRMLMQESLNQSTTAGLIRLTRRIMLGTLIVEGIGAMALSIAFIPQYGVKRGIFYGIFHSVSAFCNAGFDLIGETSLTRFIYYPPVTIAISLLIIFGSLGFGVWFDIVDGWRQRRQKNRSFKGMMHFYQMQTKLVLVMTASLLLLATTVFFFLEGANPATLEGKSVWEKIQASFFQSVTLRTAGFYTIDFTDMTQASQFLSIFMMFIGGSPGGTAGGIKTVTMALLLMQVIANVRGREEINLFQRRVDTDTVKRALSLIIIGLFVVVTMIFILSITENAELMKIAFEVVSAFATVGLSLNFTGELTAIGKILIAITMFIGRLGPVTIAFALAMQSKKSNKVKNPTTKLMVG